MAYNYETNPYYNPQNIGLTLVAEFNAYEPNYSFDLFVLWREDETGKFYVGGDSGCSCPSPFESFDFPQDFIEVRSANEVMDALDDHFPPTTGDSYRQRNPIDDFRTAVRAAF